MQKIEEYINYICKNTRGSKTEIDDLKQELRNHLLQTVQELKDEGKSEQEGIELAISRFGAKTQLQDELAQVFSVQRKFGQVMLIVALIFLALGISCIVIERVTNANFIQRYNTLNWESKTITNVAKTGNLETLDKTVKKLFVETAKNQIAYVALERLPDNLDMENLPPVQPISLGEIMYKYPADLKNVKEFGNNSGGEFFTLGNMKMYLEIGMKEYSNSNKFFFFKLIGIGFCMLYWVLFGIWATINAYHLRKLNTGWAFLFFALNIIGYLFFQIDDQLGIVNRLRVS